MAFRKLESTTGGMYNGSPGFSPPSSPVTDAGVSIIPTSDSLPDTGYFNLEGGVAPATDREMASAVGTLGTPVRFVSEPTAPDNLFNAFMRLVIVTTSALDPDEFPGGSALTNGCRLTLEVTVPGVGVVPVSLDGKLPLKDLKDLLGIFPGVTEIPITGAKNVIELSCPLKELFDVPFMLDAEPATERRLVFAVHDSIAATAITSMRIATAGWTVPKL